MKKLAPIRKILEFSVVLTIMILLVFSSELKLSMIKLIGDKTTFRAQDSCYKGDIEFAEGKVRTLSEDAYFDVAPVWNAKYMEFSMDQNRTVRILYGTNESVVNNDQYYEYVRRDGKPYFLLTVPGVNMIRVYIENKDDSAFQISDITVYSMENFYGVYACSVLFAFVIALILSTIGYVVFQKWPVSERIQERLIMLGMGIYSCICIGEFLVQKQLKISFANMMFHYMPFTSQGFRVAGPMLSDVADARLPVLYRIFVQHKFSSWNDAMLFGKSSNSIANMFNPFNWGFLGGMEFGQIYMLVLKLTVALICMYVLLRHFRCDKIPAAVGAVTFACCSTMVMWAGWNHSAVICLMPLLIWCLDCFISEADVKRYYYLIGISVILIVQLYCAMPAYVAYYVYMGFAFAVYRFIQLRKKWLDVVKDCLFIGVSMIMAALTSAAYTIYTYISTADYQEERIAMASNVLKLKYLRSILFPYWRTNLYKHMNEVTLYTGLLFVFILVLVVLKKRMHPIGFWIGVSVVCLSCIYVEWTGNFFKLLPFINTSSKLRVVTLVNFSLAVLAGLLVDELWKANDTKLRSYIGAAVLLIIPCAIAGVLAVMKRKGLAEIPQRDTWDEIKLALVLMLLYGISLAVLYVYKKKSALVLTGMLTCFTMFNFAMNYMPLVDSHAPAIPEATESIEYMQENIGDSRMIPYKMWNLFPNTQTYYGLRTIVAHSIGATDELLAKYYRAIYQDIYKTPTYLALRGVDSINMLKYSGVKYILMDQLEDSVSIPLIEVNAIDVKDFADGERIYELECTERVFFANQVIQTQNDDETIAAMVEEYLPNTIFVNEQPKETDMTLSGSEILEYQFNQDNVTVKVHVDGSGYVVLNDQYDKGWKAKVNGENAEIERVNVLFRGVYLPQAGDYEIKMHYQNNRLMVCIWISVVGCILTILYIVFIVRYVKKTQQPKEDKTTKKRKV